MSISIKDAPLVEKVKEEIKIPISDGSGTPKSINISQIKNFSNKEVITTIKELEDRIKALEENNADGLFTLVKDETTQEYYIHTKYSLASEGAVSSLGIGAGNGGDVDIVTGTEYLYLLKDIKSVNNLVVGAVEGYSLVYKNGLWQGAKVEADLSEIELDITEINTSLTNLNTKLGPIEDAYNKIKTWFTLLEDKQTLITEYNLASKYTVSSLGISTEGDEPSVGGANALYQLYDVLRDGDAVAGASEGNSLVYKDGKWQGVMVKADLSEIERTISDIETALNNHDKAINANKKSIDTLSEQVSDIKDAYDIIKTWFTVSEDGQTLITDYNLASKYTVSSLGIGEGGSTGGSGFSILQSWEDDSDSSEVMALGSNLGRELYADISVIKNENLKGISSRVEAVESGLDSANRTLTTHNTNIQSNSQSIAGINERITPIEDAFNEIKTWFRLEGGVLRTTHSLASDQTVSSLGVGSDNGGSGVSYDRLDNWDNYVEGDGSVLSSDLGYGLLERIIDLEEGTSRDYASIEEKVNKNTNAITNLSTSLNDFLTGVDVDDTINRWKELEKFLEGYTETATLADLLKGKVDTNAYNTAIDGINETLGIHGTAINSNAANITSINTTLLNHNTRITDNANAINEIEKTLADWFTLENGVLHSKYGLASDKTVSSLGVGSSEGGGVSYNRLDSWDSYTADKAGYVLSAALGYDLKTRLDNLDLGDFDLSGYLTKSEAQNTYATIASLDSFATKTWVRDNYINKDTSSIYIQKIENNVFKGGLLLGSTSVMGLTPGESEAWKLDNATGNATFNGQVTIKNGLICYDGSNLYARIHKSSSAFANDLSVFDGDTDTGFLRVSLNKDEIATYTGYGSTKTSYIKVSSGEASFKSLKVNDVVIGSLAFKNNLVASDIPSLSWNKITSDKPTTLSGYGITDALKVTIPYSEFPREVELDYDDIYCKDSLTIDSLWFNGYFSLTATNNGLFYDGYDILDGWNFSNYALPLTGGEISGNLTVSEWLAVQDVIYAHKGLEVSKTIKGIAENDDETWSINGDTGAALFDSIKIGSSPSIYKADNNALVVAKSGVTYKTSTKGNTLQVISQGAVGIDWSTAIIAFGGEAYNVVGSGVGLSLGGYVKGSYANAPIGRGVGIAAVSEAAWYNVTGLAFFTNSGTSDSADHFTEKLRLTAYGSLIPKYNTSQVLGNSDNRWSYVYSANGDFSGSVTIGDAKIWWDATNKVLRTNVSFASDKTVSSLGVGSESGGGGTGGYASLDNVASDVLPSASNTFTIGNSSRLWKAVYANSFYLGTTNVGESISSLQSGLSTANGNIGTLNTRVTNIEGGYAKKATTLAGYGITDGFARVGRNYSETEFDFNTYTDFACKEVRGPEVNYVNSPQFANEFGLLVNLRDYDGFAKLQLYGTEYGGLKFRAQHSGSSQIGSLWHTVLDDKNFSDYALPLSGGTISGVITLDNYTNSYSHITFKNNRVGSGGFADSLIEVTDGNGNRVGSLGMYGTTSVSYYYLGHNNFNGDNLRVYADKVTFGNKTVLHAGNIGDYALPNKYIESEPTESGYGLWGNVGAYLSAYFSSSYNLKFRVRSGGALQLKTHAGDVGTDWSTIIHEGNIGSQSVNYATSAGNADNATKWNGFKYYNEAADYFNDKPYFKLVTIRIKGAYTNSAVSFDVSGRSKGVAHIEVYFGSGASVGVHYASSVKVTGSSVFADKIRAYTVGNETDSSGNIIAKVIEVWYTKRSEGYDSVVVQNVHWGISESVEINCSIYSSLPTSYESYVDATMGSIYGSITKLTTPRTIWGQSFDGSGDVYGNLYMPNASAIYYKDSSNANKNVIEFSSTNNLHIGDGTSAAGYDTLIKGNNLYLQYSTSKKVGILLNSSGNVTIGSSDLAGTSAKLYVDGCLTLGGLSQLNKPQIKFAQSGDYFDLTGNFVFAPNSGSWSIFSESTSNTLFRVLKGGNVLIGTTTDSGFKLDVNGKTKIDNILTVNYSSGTRATGIEIQSIEGGESSIGFKLNNATRFVVGCWDDSFYIWNSAVKSVLNINNSGNVTIGSSDLAGTSYKLYVNGNASITEGVTTDRVFISQTKDIARGISTSFTDTSNDSNGIARPWYGLSFVSGNTYEQTYLSGYFGMTFRTGGTPYYFVYQGGGIRPWNDGTQNCGTIGFRWNNVVAVNGNYSGNMLISGGTTIGSTNELTGNTYKLYVNGNSYVDGELVAPYPFFGYSGSCDVWFLKEGGYSRLNAASSLAFTVGYDANNIALAIETDKSATFYGSLTVSGDTSLSSSLTVQGKTELESGLDVIGLIQGLDSVGGDTTWKITSDGSATVKNIKVGSNERIHGGGNNFYIGNASNAGWVGMQDICSQDALGDSKWSIRTDGRASFGSTLKVAGATTLSSTLGVTGVATFNSNIKAKGYIYFGANDEAWIYWDAGKKVLRTNVSFASDKTVSSLGVGSESGGGGSADWGAVPTDILPISDDYYNIGSPSLRFSEGHFNNVYADAVEVGSCTIYSNGNASFDSLSIGGADAATQTWVNTRLASYISKEGGSVSGTLTAGTAIYTGEKTAAWDGKSGAAIMASGNLVLVGTNPHIYFGYGNATTSTSSLEAIDDGGFRIVYNMEVFTSTVNKKNHIQLNYGNTRIYRLNNDSSGMQFQYGTSASSVSTKGTFSTSGAYSASSDITKKNILSYNAGFNVHNIAEAPIAYFTWKDLTDNRVNLGSIAQYWQLIAPECIYGTEGIDMTMDYSTLGLVSSIINARAIVSHENEIEKLKRRVEELENENKRLQERVDALVA